MFFDEYNNKISTYCFGRNKVCGDGDKILENLLFIIVFPHIFKKGQPQIAINLALFMYAKKSV